MATIYDENDYPILAFPNHVLKPLDRHQVLAAAIATILAVVKPDMTPQPVMADGMDWVANRAGPDRLPLLSPAEAVVHFRCLKTFGPGGAARRVPSCGQCMSAYKHLAHGVRLLQLDP